MSSLLDKVGKSYYVSTTLTFSKLALLFIEKVKLLTRAGVFRTSTYFVLFYHLRNNIRKIAFPSILAPTQGLWAILCFYQSVRHFDNSLEICQIELKFFTNTNNTIWIKVVIY